MEIRLRRRREDDVDELVGCLDGDAELAGPGDVLAAR
jgi:hypothetical protein